MDYQIRYALKFLLLLFIKIANWVSKLLQIKQNMIDSFVADICFILLVLFSVFITLLNLQKLTSLFKRMHICGKIR